MLFKELDIDFSMLNGTEFENLCYDLIENNNFFDLVWIKGAGDKGRDIEANLVVQYSLINEVVERWHFECKNHSSGVGQAEIHDKIGWAQARNINKLVFLVSPHLTPDAKEYIEKMKDRSYCELYYIESEKLKKLILKTPLLIEKYFLSEARKLLLNSIDEYLTASLTAEESKINAIVKKEEITEQLDLNELTFLLYCALINYDSPNDIWNSIIKKIINISVKKEISILNKLGIENVTFFGAGRLLNSTEREIPQIEGEFTEEERHFIELDRGIRATTCVNYSRYKITNTEHYNNLEYVKVDLPDSESSLEILIGTKDYKLFIETNYTDDAEDFENLDS